MVIWYFNYMNCIIVYFLFTLTANISFEYMSIASITLPKAPCPIYFMAVKYELNFFNVSSP